MWIILSTLCLHVLFIAFIFDIYFRNPIVTIYPAYSPPSAISKRVVIFLADGLNSESLFGIHPGEFSSQYPIIQPPFIKQLVFSNAKWGISRVPISSHTNPNPGLINILTGFPFVSESAFDLIDNQPFDSVLNQSDLAWTWTEDLGLTGLKHVVSTVCKRNLIDDREENAIDIDNWIAKQVIKFFRLGFAENLKQLYRDKLIFLVHLPGTGLFSRTTSLNPTGLNATLTNLDQLIGEITAEVERFYNDRNTTFIFTSTRGSYVLDYDTTTYYLNPNTPYIIWGAGINQTQRESLVSDLFQFQPRVDMDQTSLAGVIATLLGIKFPKHSLGVLPMGILDMALESYAYTIEENMMQLLAGYSYKKMDMLKDKYFFTYRKFGNETILDRSIRSIRSLLHQKHYLSAINLITNLSYKIQNGIIYMNNYYRERLTNCLFCSITLWILLLFALILGDKLEAHVLESYYCIFTEFQWHSILSGLFVLSYISVCLSSYYVYISRLPVLHHFYLGLPQILISLTVTSIYTWKKAFFIYVNYPTIEKIFCLGSIIVFTVILNALVLALTKTYLFVLFLFCTSLWLLISQTRPLPTTIAWKWVLSTLCLSIFPMATTWNVNWDLNNDSISMECILRIIGCCFWICISFYFIHKEVTRRLRANEEPVHLLIFCQPTYISTAIVISCLLRGNFIPIEYEVYARYASWIVSGFSLLTPLFASLTLKRRLYSVILALSAPSILLSVGHDSLFLVGVCVFMVAWVEVENELVRREAPLGRNQLKTIAFNLMRRNNQEFIHFHLRDDDFRLSLYGLIYIFFAIFGNGRITRYDKFDPEVYKCFLSEFTEPFVTVLYIIKLAIPILIVCTAMQTVMTVVKTSVRKCLYIIMAYCTILTFFGLLQVHSYEPNMRYDLPLYDFIVFECSVIAIGLAYIGAMIFTNISADRLAICITNIVRRLI